MTSTFATNKNEVSSEIMLKRSTIQLLRFHFSFFLMPVFMFALSEVEKPDWRRAILVFIILHLLVYPSSNGYNSYMDKDAGSIGGIEKPLQPTIQLFWITLIMDIIAIGLSLLISRLFTTGILFYILASRAYSYRGIRLKKYPFIGYLTVIFFQGALTFWLVYHGSHQLLTTEVPGTGMIASSLLIGGFYPLTQIYQHEADRKDGVMTISAFLGYRGTFVFTAIIYIVSLSVLAKHYFSKMEVSPFLILTIFMSPIIVYFFVWGKKVWNDPSVADFKNTMRMNLIACSCTNLAFLIILITRYFE